MNPIRFTACATLATILATPAAHAMTATEHQVDAASAPHLALAAARKPVTVHYVHLKDDYHNNPMAKTHLATLKQTVATCVAANRRLGRPVHAPTEFPDQYIRNHEFEYSAPNRRIVYTVGYSVEMADDCSLVEMEKRDAVLTSSKGTCEIDLVNKKASGVCDATGHADAPPFPRAPSRAQNDAAIAAMQADPRMAGQAALIRQLANAPRGPAARRTVAGHVCEVVDGIGGIQGCVSKEGSFVPSTGTEGVTLTRTVASMTSTAVDAKFDMPIDPAIFTPYRTGGYRITAEREE
jgi:hypothetical protein